MESEMRYVQHSRRASSETGGGASDTENRQPQTSHHDKNDPISRKRSNAPYESDRDRYYFNPVLNLKKYQIDSKRAALEKSEAGVFSDEELDDSLAEWEELPLAKRAMWLKSQLDDFVNKNIHVYYTLPSPGRIADRRDYSVYEGQLCSEFTVELISNPSVFSTTKSIESA